MRFTEILLIMNDCHNTQMINPNNRIKYRASGIPKSSIPIFRRINIKNVDLLNIKDFNVANLKDKGNRMQKQKTDAFSAKVIRAGIAKDYLGMCKTEFSKSIKPYLTAIKIGTQGVGYERDDLDSAWEKYKKNNIKKEPSIQPQEHSECQKNRAVTTLTRSQKGSSSIKSSITNEFDTLLSMEKAKQRKLNGS